MCLEMISNRVSETQAAAKGEGRRKTTVTHGRRRCRRGAQRSREEHTELVAACSSSPAASPGLHTPMQLKQGMGACLRPTPRTDNGVLVAKSLLLCVNVVRGGQAALCLFGLLPPPRVRAGGHPAGPEGSTGAREKQRPQADPCGKSVSECKDASACGGKG